MTPPPKLRVVPDLPPCPVCKDMNPTIFTTFVCDCKRMPLTAAAIHRTSAAMMGKRHLK